MSPQVAVWRRRARRAIAAAVAAVLFVAAWLFRFNDPGGSFAGLSDDHFFYVVRGWQILFGDLPVRDFVDHGAPLYYYVAAAVQQVERGTLSELVFSVTALSLGASLTFLLAATASGSMAAGLAGALFQILLEPRFYNYPKILVYTAAIPALWRLANRPAIVRVLPVAVVAAVGGLLRHDHGVFVGVATLALLLLLEHVPWRTRLRLALVFVGATALMLLPYVAFVEWHGGVLSYLQQASAWAERDRARAPVVWPGLFGDPDGDNRVAWTFYAELLLPAAAAAALALRPDAFRPGWTQARAKIGIVAVLALVLDAGFLRSPLEARLADPSVPLAILIAWLLAAIPRALLDGQLWRPRVRTSAVVARAAVAALAVPLLLVLASGASWDLRQRLEKRGFAEGLDAALAHADHVAAQVRSDWNLATWVDRDDRPDLIGLALYLNACTAPADRVLVQGYLPQVLGLARRAFAGGHADLRPGFFTGGDAQALTVARLRSQSVPVILLETGESYDNFRESFPIVMSYLDRYYRAAGVRVFDGRFGVTLLVRRDRAALGRDRWVGWPCYSAASGRP